MTHPLSPHSDHPVSEVQEPTAEEVDRLEKAAWDADVAQVLIWYRDRIGRLAGELRAVDLVLDRRDALAGIDGRVDKVLACIRAAQSVDPKAELVQALASLHTAQEAQDQLVIDQVLAHWFTQGAEAAIGKLDYNGRAPANADELIVCIYKLFREAQDQLQQERDQYRETCLRYEGLKRQLETAYNTVAAERAASFERLSKAVGGVGCTPWQAEVDIEIEARILSLQATLTRVQQERWQPIETAPQGLAVLVDNGGFTCIAHFDPTCGQWRCDAASETLWEQSPPAYWMHIPEPLAALIPAPQDSQ